MSLARYKNGREALVIDQLWSTVGRSVVRHVQSGAIYIHHCCYCSGGCGRTGTYIAISILLERLKTEGVVDIFQTARTLRLQRPSMVQSIVSTCT